MKFKLANGGVVASMKQPLQNKNFDRIEFGPIDQTGFEPFDENGVPDMGDVSFSIQIYNPSTHLIRKSHNPGNGLKVAIGPRTKGHAGSSKNYHITIDCWLGPNGGDDEEQATGGVIQSIYNLNYGQTFSTNVVPRIGDIFHAWSHTVSPFNGYWTIRSGLDVIDDFRQNYYDVIYCCKIWMKSGGGHKSDFINLQMKFITVHWCVHNN